MHRYIKTVPDIKTVPADWTLTVTAGSLTGALLDEVASGTRAAFASGDLLPGLPEPDGLGESPGSVAADLAAGAWLCLARAGDGSIIGSVRAFARPDADLDGQTAWVVRRLAVVPHLRGSGLAQALARRLEDEARAAGARAVRLETVVERGNPVFYARIGYATVGHFANPDKPLSEVSMRRVLDRPPVRLDYPWQGESAPGGYRLLVTWHTDGARTVAQVNLDVDDALRVSQSIADQTGLDFAGADGWRDAEKGIAATLSHRLAGAAGSPAASAAMTSSMRDGSRTVTFAGPPAGIPAYRMPRTVHPELLALWRLAWPPKRRASNLDRTSG